MGFSVRVLDRNGNGVLLPTGVAMRPVSWSAAAVGGPVAAEVECAGSADVLLSLSAWLGYRLEIWNDAGQVVWWGQVQVVEVTAGGVRRGVSIAEVVNRLRLLYVRRVAGGGEEAAETSWIEDETSIARYGQRERVYTGGTMTQAQADATAALLLTKLAVPQRSVRVEENSSAGRILCRGWFSRLDDVYFESPAGLEEHIAAQGEMRPLGLGFTSAYLAFVGDDGGTDVHEIYGRFQNFGYENLPIVISGTSLHNNTWYVQSVDGRDPVSYSSNQIHFALNDDMYDNDASLSFIATGDVIWVSGAAHAANNGAKLIKTTGAGHVEASPGWNGGFVDSDGPGPTVTVRRGSKATLHWPVQNEAPNGTTVETVTAAGQRFYQSFGLAANVSWTVDTIELRVRRVGSPADNFRVALYTDVSGAPGTLVEQVSVAGSSLPDAAGWVSFNFANTATLAFGTVYGLLVDRSGAMDPDHYYEVEIDPDAAYSRGALRLYDGSGYGAPSGDLVFRVLGSVDSSTLVSTVVAAAGIEVWGTFVEESGVDAWQYASGEETAGAVVRRLLEQGDEDGNRLMCQVTQELLLRMYDQPVRTTAWLRWNGGRIVRNDGQPLQDGYLPAGSWLVLADVPASSEAWSGLDRVFVERASWRDGSLDFEVEGQKSVAERLGVQQG
jgi:hypothetical protein